MESGRTVQLHGLKEDTGLNNIIAVIEPPSDAQEAKYLQSQGRIKVNSARHSQSFLVKIENIKDLETTEEPEPIVIVQKAPEKSQEVAKDDGLCAAPCTIA
jgi:hypothetical protein